MGDWVADQQEVLWLRHGAPVEMLRASHQALARIHHPDVGGDEVSMKAVNGAVEVILAIE